MNNNNDVNVIVQQSCWEECDKATIFSNEDVVFVDNVPMFKILKEFGFFPSTSQAKKAGWVDAIPKGYTEFTIGKLKRKLCIWNPTAYIKDYN